MWKDEYTRVNDDIIKHRKAVIGFGCSFSDGQGAIEEEILNNYPWYIDGANTLKWDKLTREQQSEVRTKYHDVRTLRWMQNGTTLDFHLHERRRAYSYQLAEMLGDHAGINFGMRGNGNRASISQLFTHPELLLHRLEEIIVIYTPAGVERFDFFQKTLNDHHNFITMWPHEDSFPEDIWRSNLWGAYKHYLLSDLNILQEQVLQVRILETWLKSTGAKWKLIIVPAYDYALYEQHYNGKAKEFYKKNWPHQYMWKPDGELTFMNLVEQAEGLDRNSYYSYMGKGSPGGWVTPCAHPSIKGHKLFAEKLYEKIKNEA